MVLSLFSFTVTLTVRLVENRLSDQLLACFRGPNSSTAGKQISAAPVRHVTLPNISLPAAHSAISGAPRVRCVCVWRERESPEEFEQLNASPYSDRLGTNTPQNEAWSVGADSLQ